MNEISGFVLNHILEFAKSNNLDITSQDKFEDDSWYDYSIFQDFLNQLEKQKNKTLWTKAGDEIYPRAIEKNVIEPEENPTNGVINIHKLYIQVVRGDNTGIWKTRDVQPGFAKIEENTIFPELFTKGVLQSLLKQYSCIGPMVKQTKSRYMDDDVYFNEFELTWMKKVK